MPRSTDVSSCDRIWALLLAAVEELHGRGFTAVRAIPSFGPVGYWRLQITTAVNLRDGVNLPLLDDSAVFGLSAGGFPTVGSLEVSATTTADEVAEEFLRSARLGRRRMSTTPSTACGSRICVDKQRSSVLHPRRSATNTVGGGAREWTSLPRRAG